MFFIMYVMDIPTPATVLQKKMKMYPLCDSCIGRLYRSYFQNKTNQALGKIIRRKIKQDKPVVSSKCWLCEGLTDEIAHFQEEEIVEDAEEPS